MIARFKVLGATAARPSEMSRTPTRSTAEETGRIQESKTGRANSMSPTLAK